MKRFIATAMCIITLFTAFAFSACGEKETTEEKIYLTDWALGEISDGITVSPTGAKTSVVFTSTGDNSDASVISNTTRKISYSYINVNISADKYVNLQAKMTYSDKSGEIINGTANISADVEAKDYVIYISEYGKLLSMSILPLKINESSGTITVSKPYATDLYNGGSISVCTYDKEFTPEPVQEDDGSAQTEGGETSTTTPSYGWDGIIVDDCPVPQSERLYKKYAGLFEIGMTVGYDRYTSYSDIAGHYGSMTCENEMKMYTIAPGDTFDYKNPAAYDFSKADEILTYMRKRGKKIRGHALIWHYECPGWLKNEKDKATLLDKIDTYCYTVVKHFSEKFGDVIYAWDVVNEAISDNYNGGGAVSQTVKTVFGNNDDGCNGMRNDLFSVAGYDYVTTAFKAARRADANVKLYYNDYNIVSEIQKCRGVIDLVSKIIEAGAPIDGVGLQSHFKNMGTNAVESAEKAINYMIKLGEVTNHPLDIQITELDVENRGNNDSGLATFYGNLFALYRKYAANISSVTFWAVADDYSWLDYGQYNMAYPTLFDKSHNKKPAFDAVYNFS